MSNLEYLDLVNKFDQVIGQAPRAWIHRHGWQHRASHLLVINPEKKIFLQKRGLHQTIDPGRWDTSVGGHVMAGETYRQCIQRETREELGIDLPSPRFWFKLEATTFHEFMAIYYTPHTGPFQLQAKAIMDGQWFSLPSIWRWMEQHPDELAGSLQVIVHALAQQPALIPTELKPT